MPKITHIEIRHDVGMAMFETVTDLTPFDRLSYRESIVPGKEPMDGFGASALRWGTILGAFERNLETRNTDYVVFDVTDNFVRRSRKLSLEKTNDQITQTIFDKLAEVGGGESHV